MNILIVDDDEDVRAIARMSLEILGRMHVTDACSGAAALERVATLNLDGILLDLDMPDMDGMSVLAALRAEAATMTIPVILLVSEMSRARAGDWRVAGATGTIRKPFDPSLLANQVRALLSSAA